MDQKHSSSNVTNIYVNGGYESDVGEQLDMEQNKFSNQPDVLPQNELIQDSSNTDEQINLHTEDSQGSRFTETVISKEQGSQVNVVPAIIPVNLPVQEHSVEHKGVPDPDVSTQEQYKQGEHSVIMNEVPTPKDSQPPWDDNVLLTSQNQDANTDDAPIYPGNKGSGFDVSMTTVYVKNFAQPAFHGRSVVHVQNLPRKEVDSNDNDNTAVEQVGLFFFLVVTSNCSRPHGTIESGILLREGYVFTGVCLFTHNGRVDNITCVMGYVIGFGLWNQFVHETPDGLGSLAF